ncbi:MAG: peptidase S10 [Candidatus Eremiobacteraeota bacterium]|nr:peptidase S10 [Candidatus Eremiobacteraeota bacterium]
MKKTLLLMCSAALLAWGSAAPDRAAAASSRARHGAVASEDGEVTRSVTHGNVTIDGRRIGYTATAGTLTLKNDKGEPIASQFYVAYTQDGVVDRGARPITFLYNGGPGSSTIWLHMGAFGPRRVATPDAQTALPASHALLNNDDSLLDKSDLVFIDAVGTGFSRIIGKGTPKNFFGVDADIGAFGQFIERYVTQTDRWKSPKYLLGESYGTTRSAGVVDFLQEKGVAMNGVILVSSILNFANDVTGPGGNDMAYILYLPTMAAAAWYHDKLRNKPPDLDAFLQTVRRFAAGPYAQALMAGSQLGDAERASVLGKLHEYTGISEKYYRQADLRLDPERFQKELLRDQGLTVGRLDGRFVGRDIDINGDSPDYDPSDNAISAAFTAAFHTYVADDLKYRSDRPYNVTNYPVVGHDWDWKRKQDPLGAPNVSGDLRDAMIKNPGLRVFSANGYFDFATPFFETEYTLDHLNLEQPLRNHIQYGYYQSGHMIYLHVPALAKLHADLARFYDATR